MWRKTPPSALYAITLHANRPENALARDSTDSIRLASSKKFSSIVTWTDALELGGASGIGKNE
jgi:hypothetical protein